MKALMVALMLGAVATPAIAQKTTTPRAEAAKDAKPAKKKAEDFDIGQMMAMFDKIFPAQPDPAPARLALARTTAVGVLPSGAYAAMFDDMMSGVVENVLSINPADFGEKDAKSKSGQPTTLRQQLAKDDPHFEERMRIMRRVVREELIKISALMEPQMREGLARSIARRFDEKQLGEINAFLATPSGRAFAGQTMRMWIDPDVLRSMMQSMPHMITAMPGAMMRLEAETAHLPKPKKAAKDKAPAADADDQDEE